LPRRGHPYMVRGQWTNDPFTELQVGGGGDAGFLIELADEVEEQRAARLWEGDVEAKKASRCYTRGVGQAKGYDERTNAR